MDADILITRGHAGISANIVQGLPAVVFVR